MATAIVLILLGLLGPIAAAQWRAGRWLRPAAWIATKLSPPFLAGVQLDKSEPAVDQGKDVTQFQLTLGYSRPDTTLLHRVPLTLSVK